MSMREREGVGRCRFFAGDSHFVSDEYSHPDLGIQRLWGQEGKKIAAYPDQVARMQSDRLFLQILIIDCTAIG